VNLSNEDVQDILRLLDSLPYGELTVETSGFTLRLRRSAAGGWTQERHVRSEPGSAAPASPHPQASGLPPPGDGTSPGSAAGSAAGGGPAGDLREVLAPLLGTFYRAPQPGAPPFVDIGSHVEPDTVVAIIETMKLMNPVYAGTAGTVSEICLGDGQFAERDAVLMRVRAG
jgi:acetyl-CoA carboxylase biotin carboxyl carrier protein